MPQYSEQEILQGCRSKERFFQELLYKSYYSLFLKICARYAKCMEDAEQLLNDGFLKIFGRIDSYANAGSFEGWMKRIMVNTCLDYLRSSEIKTSMQMHLNAELVMDQTPSTDHSGLEQIEFKELLGIIQSLPVMTRTVFNLFVFEGYSHKQIMEALSISTGTSHWHIHQARNILQKKIMNMNAQKPFYANK